MYIHRACIVYVYIFLYIYRKLQKIKESSIMYTYRLSPTGRLFPRFTFLLKTFFNLLAFLHLFFLPSLCLSSLFSLSPSFFLSSPPSSS